MIDVGKAYLEGAYIAGLLMVPLSGVATAYAWTRVRKYRKGGDLPGLMIVLAIIATIALVGSAYFATLIFATRIAHLTLPRDLEGVTITALVALEAIPIIIMAYLVWRDRDHDRDEPA